MPHLLIVDDERYQRILLCELLASNPSFTFTEAENGQQALDVARTEHFDLVIMDTMMPIMDGLTACRAFKSDAALQAIPILLTTSVDARLSHGWSEAGADDLLNRPFEAHELLAKVRRALAHSSSQS